MQEMTHKLLSAVMLSFCILTPIHWTASAAIAQFPAIPTALGFDSGASEDSRYPIKIELRGFLNSDPKPESLGVVSLGVNSYQGIYKFDIRQARVVDAIRIPISSILRHAGKYVVDFNVSGRRELLTKIGQSPPGTPLVITGMFQQRRHRLTLLSIDVVDRAEVTLPVQEAMSRKDMEQQE